MAAVAVWSVAGPRFDRRSATRPAHRGNGPGRQGIGRHGRGGGTVVVVAARPHVSGGRLLTTA